MGRHDDLFPNGRFRARKSWGFANLVGYFAEDVVESWLKSKAYRFIHAMTVDSLLDQDPASLNQDTELGYGETRRQAEEFMAEEFGAYRTLWKIVKDTHPCFCGMGWNVSEWEDFEKQWTASDYYAKWKAGEYDSEDKAIWGVHTQSESHAKWKAENIALKRYPANMRFCRVDLIARMPAPTLVEVKGNNAGLSRSQRMFLSLGKEYGFGAKVARVLAVAGQAGKIEWKDWE